MTVAAIEVGAIRAVPVAPGWRRRGGGPLLASSVWPSVARGGGPARVAGTGPGRAVRTGP